MYTGIQNKKTASEMINFEAPISFCDDIGVHYCVSQKRPWLNARGGHCRLYVYMSSPANSIIKKYLRNDFDKSGFLFELEEFENQYFVRSIRTGDAGVENFYQNNERIRQNCVFFSDYEMFVIDNDHIGRVDNIDKKNDFVNTFSSTRARKALIEIAKRVNLVLENSDEHFRSGLVVDDRYLCFESTPMDTVYKPLYNNHECIYYIEDIKPFMIVNLLKLVIQCYAKNNNALPTLFFMENKFLNNQGPSNLFDCIDDVGYKLVREVTRNAYFFKPTLIKRSLVTHSIAYRSGCHHFGLEDIFFEKSDLLTHIQKIEQQDRLESYLNEIICPASPTLYTRLLKILEENP